MRHSHTTFEMSWITKTIGLTLPPRISEGVWKKDEQYSPWRDTNWFREVQWTWWICATNMLTKVSNSNKTTVKTSRHDIHFVHLEQNAQSARGRNIVLTANTRESDARCSYQCRHFSYIFRTLMRFFGAGTSEKENCRLSLNTLNCPSNSNPTFNICISNSTEASNQSFGTTLMVELTCETRGQCKRKFHLLLNLNKSTDEGLFEYGIVPPSSVFRYSALHLDNLPKTQSRYLLSGSISTLLCSDKSRTETDFFLSTHRLFEWE